MDEMKLTGPAFEGGGSIPAKYTCDGKNISPPLAITNVPEGARPLVLIVEDPDVPAAVRDEQMFDHWVLFNIDPSTKEIAEHSAPGKQGANTSGKAQFTGPCPPPQFEPKEHRYFFILYALDTTIDEQEGATKEAVRAAMRGHIITKAELVGTYERSK